jgi:hypothetical protein
MTARRLKLVMLLGGIALSGLVLLGWTQEWFTLALSEGASLSIAGDVAAPALAVLALTCLILNGALSIAGPVFRVVLGVLEAVLGATVVLSGVIAIANPVGASEASVSGATGVSGADAGSLVAAVAVTAWPWASTIAGAILVVIGIGVVATVKRWPDAGRKYSAVRMEPTDRTAVDDWDALSEGQDPT